MTTTPARRPTPLGAVQGALALDLSVGSADLLDPPPARREGGGPPADVVPIDRRLRGEIEAWAPRFVQAAIEIAAAERPPQQLLRWTAPRVYQDLQRRARLVARTRQQGRAVSGRPRVVSTRACVVSAEAVEVSAHLRHGNRSRALAARFERRADRWVCTALEFA